MKYLKLKVLNEKMFFMNEEVQVKKLSKDFIDYYIALRDVALLNVSNTVANYSLSYSVEQVKSFYFLDIGYCHHGEIDENAYGKDTLIMKSDIAGLVISDLKKFNNTIYLYLFLKETETFDLIKDVSIFKSFLEKNKRDDYLKEYNKPLFLKKNDLLKKISFYGDENSRISRSNSNIRKVHLYHSSSRTLRSITYSSEDYLTFINKLKPFYPENWYENIISLNRFHSPSYEEIESQDVKMLFLDSFAYTSLNKKFLFEDTSPQKNQLVSLTKMLEIEE